MKIAITSDEHLGKTLYRNEEDSLNKFERKLYNVWKENVDIIIKEQPDIYISCGDIFDTANPKIIPISKYKEQMVRLRDANIPSLLIMGNHDFAFKNKQNDTSAVRMIIQDSGLKVEKYAEYNLDYYIKDKFLFVLCPFIYGNKNIIDDMWTQAKFLCEEYKDLHKILITHGVTELYVEKFPQFGSEGMVVPKWLIELFDEVIIGHIHVPYQEKYKGTTIISPGSLINYVENEDDTGPIFMEFDGTKLVKIRRTHIDTPHTIKLTCTEKDINSVLDSITENIYKITYTGDTSKIDNSKFIEARTRAINLILDIERFDKEEDLNSQTTQQNIKDFQTWIKDNYPDKLESFKQAKQEIELKMQETTSFFNK